MKNLKVIVLLSLFAASIPSRGQGDTTINENNIIKVAYGQSEKNRLVGAVDVIHGEELLHSTDYRATPALAGLASGLYVNKYSYAPGNSWAGLKVRGLSRGNMGDNPLIVVDGIPNRNFADLSMEVIESITVLKDATTKMLYGSQAADGVILVKTRHGKISERQLSFSVEGGIRQPTALPVYVDAATYAEKYNQARINDGLDPFYSGEAIASYRSQNAPLMYPDMDYYGTFLKKMSDYQRINSILTGGDEKTKYFLNAEYVRENSLLAVGDVNAFNQLNLVSNLDYRVNDLISINLNISSRIGLGNSPNITSENLFQSISTHRPNDYPFFITDDQSVDTDYLAYNTVGEFNLYGQLTRGGYIKRQDFASMSTLGIDFNLDQYIKGLSANVTLGFDTYNSIYTGKDLEFATWRIVTADSLVRIGEDEIKSTEATFADDFHRNIAGHGSLDYDRNFGKHAITGNLVYSMRQLAYKSTENWLTGVRQDYKGINLGLRVNYAFDNRYILEGTSSYMGSDKFEPEHRYKVYGAGGAAWVLSNEAFMEGISFINYLKIKGSYGVMGYDKMMDYYIYRSTFSGAGAYYFGINSSDAIDYSARISKIGNPDITFEEANEMNIGLEGTILNAVSLDVNYFDELRTGIPTTLRSTLPGYVSGIAPVGNFNEIRNSGFDLSIRYDKSVGDFQLGIGANLIYSESKYEVYDEINIYEHQNLTGKVTDVMGGLQAEGLYTSEQEIDVSSAYGEIIPGDIKYTNYINDLEDNIIDEYDFMEIGHFFPRYNYAFHLDVRYKRFSSYALGQGVADVDRLRNTAYYFNYGERKYSEEVLADDYPRLTTSTSGGHSFRNSTYWLTSGAYFKLRMLEVSYDIPLNYADGTKDMNLKVFIKGTDLFTITGFEKLDPEDIYAGVTKYPLFRTVSVGAKVNF